MFQIILRAKRANFFGIQGGEKRIDGGGVISPHGGGISLFESTWGGNFFFRGGFPPQLAL